MRFPRLLYLMPQRELLLAVAFAGLAAIPEQAQTVQRPSTINQAAPSDSNRPLPLGSLDPGGNPLSGLDASRMQHLREDERRKRLLADSARLVALTGELQAEVEKSSRDELSLDVIRKAAEIERLAHDVRERMKN